jgi:hypothetical protein
MQQGEAVVLILRPGQQPERQIHQWLSQGWLYADSELTAWREQAQKELQCSIDIVGWYIFNCLLMPAQQQ